MSSTTILKSPTGCYADAVLATVHAHKACEIDVRSQRIAWNVNDRVIITYIVRARK
jgi:hypothetical protein